MKKCLAVVGSWEQPPNIWLTIVKTHLSIKLWILKRQFPVVLQPRAFDLHSFTEVAGHYLYHFPFDLQRSPNNNIAAEEPSL